MRGLALPLLALLVLGACARIVHWQQEVKLQDGRTLVIARTSKQAGPGLAPRDTTGFARELTFVHPDTAEEIRWELPKGTSAHLLDFDGPATYLVLSANSAAEYNNWQCPNPPWIVYRHLAGIWMRVGIGDLPERFVTPNLLARPDEEKSADGRVTLSEMESYLKSARPEYRSIGRAKLNPLDQGCQEYLLRQLGREEETKIGRQPHG